MPRRAIVTNVDLRKEFRKVLWRLDYTMLAVNAVFRQGVKEMAALDDLKAEVEEVKTIEGSAITLLNGLSQMLKDAIASGNPAALQAIVADLDASSNALADAVAANTPAG